MEKAYLQNCCQENNLLLKVSKTKVEDFSKKQEGHYQLQISITWVFTSCRSSHINTLVMKEPQCLTTFDA